MKKRGFTLVEMMVVLAILGILLGVGSYAMGSLYKRKAAAAFPETLSTMIGSLPALARAKGEPVIVGFTGDVVYVALQSAAGVPVSTSVKVPTGVTIDTTQTVLATADEQGVVSAGENPLHLVVNGNDLYLFISLAGDVSVQTSASTNPGGSP